MRALAKVRSRARSLVEQLYEDRCTVIAYGKVKDPVAKITAQAETVACMDQPCRLSFALSPAAEQTDFAAGIAQSAVLLIAPEITIRPGSKIVVTREGRTESYAESGPAKVYPTHQEIALALYEERA